MKEIPLSHGKVALVDDEDFELLSKFKWYASFGSRNRKWYAVRRIRKDEREKWGKAEKISMHRYLMDPPPGFVVDHINHDSLDNRRHMNLEIITQEENMRRSPGWNKKKETEDTDFDFGEVSWT